MGQSLDISPLLVIFAVTFGGGLFGVVGMFLMIPAASVLYTLVREFVDKRLSASPVEAAKLEPQPPEVVIKRNVKRKEKKKKNTKDKTEE